MRVTDSIKSTSAVSKGIEGVVRASEPELLISVDPARQIKSCDQMNLFQKKKRSSTNLRAQLQVGKKNRVRQKTLNNSTFHRSRCKRDSNFQTATTEQPKRVYLLR